MARKLRVEYPGAIYHVMNRGGSPRADLQERCGSPALHRSDAGAETAPKAFGERAYRNRPLSDEQKASGSASCPGGIQPGGEPTDRRESNRQKSRIRARTCLRASTHRQIEHVFGYTCLRADTHRQMNQSMKGFYLRFGEK